MDLEIMLCMLILCRNCLLLYILYCRYMPDIYRMKQCGVCRAGLLSALQMSVS